MKKVTKSSAKRFIDQGSTVLDTQTNLVWMKEDDGVERNWKDAKEYCKKNKAKLPGKGWRMPTREEQLTIVDLKRYCPAADPIFKAKNAWYWTSTPCADDSAYAWYVDFNGGYVSWGYVYGKQYVRPVRQNS